MTMIYIYQCDSELALNFLSIHTQDGYIFITEIYIKMLGLGLSQIMKMYGGFGMVMLYRWIH